MSLNPNTLPDLDQRDLDGDIEPEDEHYAPCGCHDPECYVDNRDATNLLIPGLGWFVQACGLERSHLAASCVMEALKRDEQRDDDVNERRR